MAVSRFTQSFTVRLDAHAAFYVQGKKSPGFLLALVNLAVSASTSFLLFWTEEALESAVTALFAFVGCEAASAAIFSEPEQQDKAGCRNCRLAHVFHAKNSPLPIHRGLLPPDNAPDSAGWPSVFVTYLFLRANSSSTCAFCCSSASASSTDCLLSVTDCSASFTSEEYAW